MAAWVHTPAALLRRQLSHAFESARWHVAGLTDDEYFWEPHPSCWSVRRRATAVSAAPSGVGEWVIDGEWPLTGDPPLTTVAWRIVHLAAWTDVYRDWTFGTATGSFDAIDVPKNAAAGVLWLSRAQEEFAAAVTAIDDSAFEELRPAHWGEHFPVGSLVWQIAVEHLHHGAEIGVLRDIQRGHGRSDEWPEPVTVS